VVPRFIPARHEQFGRKPVRQLIERSCRHDRVAHRKQLVPAASAQVPLLPPPPPSSAPSPRAFPPVACFYQQWSAGPYPLATRSPLATAQPPGMLARSLKLRRRHPPAQQAGDFFPRSHRSKGASRDLTRQSASNHAHSRPHRPAGPHAEPGSRVRPATRYRRDRHDGSVAAASAFNLTRSDGRPSRIDQLEWIAPRTTSRTS